MKVYAAPKLKLRCMLWLYVAASAAIASSNVSGQAINAPKSQSDATKPPQFEVASIRPSDPGLGEVNGFYTYPGGRIAARGCMLQYLLMLAFDVQDFQISGGPGLMSDDRYDIQAKPPESAPSGRSNPASPKSPPNEEQRQMLQSLLIDRFQLKFHRATKEGTVYILKKGEKDLKLLPPKDKSAFAWAGSIEGGRPDVSGLRGTNISMPQLAIRLSSWLGRPVLDQTGLQGSFDFEFRTGNDDANTDRTATILTSIKGIGLRLESGKGPIDTIVIDHVEKPSEN